MDTSLHTETFNSILNAFASQHDSMETGDRVQLMQLAINIGQEVDRDPKSIKGLTDFLAHNNGDQGYVSVGKFGGYVKGQRPLKTSTKSVKTSN
jgi:hypothetical protein